MSNEHNNEDIQKILDEISAKHEGEMEVEDFEHKKSMCEAIWEVDSAILLTDRGWLAYGGSPIKKALTITGAMQFDSFRALLFMATSLSKGLSDYREALDEENDEE